MDTRFVALAGSERRAVDGARRVGPADPDESLEVSLILRAPAQIQGGAVRQRLSRAEFETTEGAQPEDVDAVRAFARTFGLRLTRINLAERSVALAGTVSTCSRAFRVDLGRYEAGGITYRGREGWIHLPEALAGAVIAVVGLDNRPAAERG